MSADLSAADARRIAITAQGLAAPRPPAVTAAELRAMIERLGVVQLDSVKCCRRSFGSRGCMRKTVRKRSIRPRIWFHANTPVRCTFSKLGPITGVKNAEKTTINGCT
jgi:hypothetical protein